MEFRQIEAELRVLFPTTHGDEFKKIGVLFAMLQGCQPAKLQRATGYDGSLIYQVIEDVETHARFAIYSGAMAPRHLWALYPQTQTLIESITGQRLIKDSARPAPIAIPKPPQPSSNTIMSANTSATACGINECARPVGHDGRHRRADSKPRAPRKTPYSTEEQHDARVSLSAPVAPLVAPVAPPEPIAPVAPVAPIAPINAPAPPAALPDVRVPGRFHFVFQPDDANAADDLRIEMSGKTSISRNQAFGWMGAIIDGE